MFLYLISCLNNEYLKAYNSFPLVQPLQFDWNKIAEDLYVKGSNSGGSISFVTLFLCQVIRTVTYFSPAVKNAHNKLV